MHKISKMLKDKKEILRFTISNIISGIYTSPNIDNNLITMAEFHDGKIIKKLIRASEHMKHA